MWLNVSETNVMMRTGIGRVSVGGSLYIGQLSRISLAQWLKTECGHVDCAVIAPTPT